MYKTLKKFLINNLFHFLRRIIKKLYFKSKFIILKLFNKNDIFLCSLSKNNFLCCEWNFSKKTLKRISQSDIFCLGIRIYDITQNSYGTKYSCVMKESDVSKRLRRFKLPLPIKGGRFKIELGYRSSNSIWITLNIFELDLGRRTSTFSLYRDSWFYNDRYKSNNNFSQHDFYYELSINKSKEGSEIYHEK